MAFSISVNVKTLIWWKPPRDWEIGSKNLNSWRIEQTKRNQEKNQRNDQLFVSSDSFCSITSYIVFQLTLV